MKREIKFRAWIPNVGWLADGFSISMDGTEWYDDNGHSWPLSDIELMQFTGLHDKNGKEIYEGDIMQHKFDERLFSCLISFDDGAFVLQNIGVDGYLMDKIRLTQTSCIERIVIGNIYENPELLNP